MAKKPQEVTVSKIEGIDNGIWVKGKFYINLLPYEIDLIIGNYCYTIPANQIKTEFMVENSEVEIYSNGIKIYDVYFDVKNLPKPIKDVRYIVDPMIAHFAHNRNDLYFCANPIYVKGRFEGYGGFGKIGGGDCSNIVSKPTQISYDASSKCLNNYTEVKKSMGF